MSTSVLSRPSTSAIELAEDADVVSHGSLRPAHQLGAWPAVPLGDPQVARKVLGIEATTPMVGRDFTTAMLREWALDDLIEDVTLAVSELLTNALLYVLRRQHPRATRSNWCWFITRCGCWWS